MENNERTRIYDIQADREWPRFASLLGLVIGLAFLVWYAKDIRPAVSSDLNSFGPAFHAEPALTVVFAIVKFCAYLFFPYIAAVWIYAPLRDFAFRREIRGRLSAVQACSSIPLWARVPFLSWFLSWGMPVPGRSAMKCIRLGEREFRIPEAPSLNNTMKDESLIGKELEFLLGAFNRVLSIDVVNQR